MVVGYGTMPRPPPAKRRGTRMYLMVTAVVVLVATALVATLRSSESVAELVEQALPYEQELCVGPVCVWASNDYERKYGAPISDGYFKGIVVELFKDTDLRVRSKGPCSIDGVPGCSSLRAMELRDYKLVADGVTIDLTAKYVRRELRALTTADRTRYFAAVHVLFEVDDERGRRLYGNDFHSASYFAWKHMVASANRDCDRWHAGPAFMNTHVAFTLEFERAIQSVDPTTCAHYWDYTIDYARDDWERSVIFAPDWFSEAWPVDTVISNGAWAYTPITKSKDKEMRNAYGLLRSPWNTNKEPFLTRHRPFFDRILSPTKLCGCEATLDILSQTPLEFRTFMPQMSGQLHGTIHAYIGGLWNIRPELVVHQWVVDNLPNPEAIFPIFKSWWRKGYVDCPLVCSLDSPNEDCMCFAHLKINNTLKFLNETGAAKSLGVPNLTEFEANVIYTQLTNGGLQGDSLSDHSPWDPMFWVIHGFQERLQNVIRFFPDIHFNDTWAWELSLTGPVAVCDWHNLDNETSLPHCDDSQLCPGHHADDLMPFEDILLDTKGALTNQEFWDLSYPFSPRLPYVYDRLRFFKQCGDLYTRILANRHPAGSDPSVDDVTVLSDE